MNLQDLLSQYNNHIVTIQVPVFGCMLHAKYLKDLSIGGEFIDVEVPKRTKRFQLQPTHKTFIVKYTTYQTCALNRLTKSLREIFNPNFLSFTVTQEKMFNDAWELYEHLLKHHDWYYHFSDDHGVWQAGQSAQNKISFIKETLASLNKEKAEELYDKYAPKQTA